MCPSCFSTELAWPQPRLALNFSLVDLVPPTYAALSVKASFCWLVCCCLIAFDCHKQRITGCLWKRFYSFTLACVKRSLFFPRSLFFSSLFLGLKDFCSSFEALTRRSGFEELLHQTQIQIENYDREIAAHDVPLYFQVGGGRAICREIDGAIVVCNARFYARFLIVSIKDGFHWTRLQQEHNKTLL